MTKKKTKKAPLPRTPLAARKRLVAKTDTPMKPARLAQVKKAVRNFRRDRAAIGELRSSRTEPCSRLVLDFPVGLHRKAKAAAAMRGLSMRSYVAGLVAKDTAEG